jgi:enoyl-CoA hydratase/carnithine racemase
MAGRGAGTVDVVTALEIEIADRVMTLTINRPHVRNAANEEVWTALESGLGEAADNPDVRVVVVTGAGGAFCSGQDLSEQPRGEFLGRMRWLGGIALKLHRLPKPTIAKVGGVAAGAGANLALGCDLVVASADARFIEIFSKRGLSVDFGGTWLLPRLVGMAKAKELALLAGPLSAGDAAAAGLINRVVPPGELDGAVAQWAAQLAAGPPRAMGFTKQMLNDSFALTLEEAVEAEARAQDVNLRGTEARQALAAFVEKRAATFG